MTDTAGPLRIAVNLVGDADHGRLAESRFVERPYLPGGEHNMYEFAFAAAALGHDVELRGWLHRPSFQRLAVGAGTQPRVELEARYPRAGDLVIVPEGWRDPLEYGQVLLSPATPALFLLAAPGLFGWPFTASWELPDPLTVGLDTVARPEHFKAASDLGFRLLTHSPAIADAGRNAGAECSFVGTGRPAWTPPPPTDKRIDVAAVMDNRWAPLAEEVLRSLEPHVTVDRVEQVDNDELLERLSRARILVWPSRIEGHATIPWEARSAGCVPVALDSNRFAVGLDPAHGALLVSDHWQLASTVMTLLEDRPRLQQLSELGRRTAPAEVDWKAYLARVEAFLASTGGPDTAVAPRAGIGEALRRRWDQRAENAQSRLEAVTGELIHRTEEVAGVRKELASVRDELDALKARRSVRTALAAARMLNR